MNIKIEKPFNNHNISSFIYLFLMDVYKLGMNTSFSQYKQKEPHYVEPMLNGFITAFKSSPNGSFSHELIKRIHKAATSHLPQAGKGVYRNEYSRFKIFFASGKNFIAPGYSATLEGILEFIDNWINNPKCPTHALSIEKNLNNKLIHGYVIQSTPKGVIFITIQNGIITHEHYNKSKHSILLNEVFTDSTYMCELNPLSEIALEKIAEKIHEIMQGIINVYEEEISLAVNDDEKLRAICKAVQHVEQLHPFSDGNVRTCYILLNKLLRDHNLSLSILLNPNKFDACHLDEIVSMVKMGQVIYQNLLKHDSNAPFLIKTNEPIYLLKEITCPAVTLAESSKVREFELAVIRGQNPTLKNQQITIFSSREHSKATQLIKEIKSLPETTGDLLNDIHRGEYGLALRKACKGHLHAVIKCLLQYQDFLDISVNDKSSNGNTALDWFDSVNINSVENLGTRALLLEKGAQSSKPLTQTN